jgi:hypothetical protein
LPSVPRIFQDIREEARLWCMAGRGHSAKQFIYGPELGCICVVYLSFVSATLETVCTIGPLGPFSSQYKDVQFVFENKCVSMIKSCHMFNISAKTFHTGLVSYGFRLYFLTDIMGNARCLQDCSEFFG